MNILTGTLDLNSTAYNYVMPTQVSSVAPNAVWGIINNGGVATANSNLLYDASVNPGASTISGGSVSFGGGTITVGRSGAIAANSAELTISSVVASPSGFTKAGWGTLLLSGANPNIGGNINLTQGTLQVSGATIDVRFGFTPSGRCREGDRLKVGGRVWVL